MVIKNAFVSTLALWLFVVTLTETLASSDDWGVSKFDVKRVSYTWTIENYPYHGKAYGEVIKSGQFTGNDSKDYKWQMMLYPRGHTPATKFWASLYLKLNTKQSAMAEIEFSIINKDGRPINIKKLRQRFPAENWGFPLFATQAALEKSQIYSPGGTLTIKIDIAFNVGLIRVAKKCSGINTEKCTSLPFTSSFMPDIDLWVDGESMKAHKAALTADSTWFKNELEFHPANHHVSLPHGIKADEFREALNFIYTGKTNADERMIKKLLVLSDKLGMKKLKLYCEESLCKSMTSRNTAEILELAKQSNAVNLKREAQNYLVASNEGIAG